MLVGAPRFFKVLVFGSIFFLSSLAVMARAGWHPRESIANWRRMSAAEKHAGAPERTSEWQHSHPLHETRIRDLEQLLPQMERLYDDSPQFASSSAPLLPQQVREAFWAGTRDSARKTTAPQL